MIKNGCQYPTNRIATNSLRSGSNAVGARTQVTGVKNQFTIFNSFILGFLSLWLGCVDKAALADPIPQQPKDSGSIAKPISTALPDKSNPLTWSTSATSLRPEKQTTPVSPGNQPDNNGTPAQINQQDNNNTPTPEKTTILRLRGNSLESSSPILTTAHHLLQGEVITRLRYRQNFPAKSVEGNLTIQPTLGFSWGITNNLEVTFDAQSVDNGGPGRQGLFNAQRTTSTGSGNIFQELTLQAKQRLWQNAEGTQALSGVVAISRGVRSYRFSRTPGDPLFAGSNTNELVPSLELPFTVTTGSNLQLTLSPKVAFLPEDNALYFRRMPLPNSGSFGTSFGIAGGAIYRLNSRLSLWGDAFIPFTGNNSISRDSGLPTRTIAFNAGLRYLVNPRLSTELFVSNTLGNTGALSVVADKDYPFLGLGVTFIPGATSANRSYPAHFGTTQAPTPDTPAGFAFFDGGTIPSGQLVTTVQGGGQGVLTAVEYGLLDDFGIGFFLDHIPGTTDESELGVSGKLRLLNQADGSPVTLSAVATLARSNNVLINYITNNANEFKQRGFKKSGFAFGNETDGQLFIITLSTPINYQFKNGNSIWLTPTIGFIQDNGLQEAGVNFGGSTPLLKNLNLIAEAGVDFSGKGNAFIGDKRETIIPWSVGLRWNPDFRVVSGLSLEAYLTNRLGSTPFQSLRVQANNPVTVGVGVRLPVQF